MIYGNKSRIICNLTLCYIYDDYPRDGGCEDASCNNIYLYFQSQQSLPSNQSPASIAHLESSL